MPIKKVIIDKANRIFQLPPSIDSLSPHAGRTSLIKKADIIDLATFQWPIGFDSDINYTAKDFLYASKSRIVTLKETIADWYNKHYKININPEKEIYIGGNISTLLMNIALTFIDNGDIVFVPELGIPTYKTVTATAGGQPVGYPISEKNNWSPSFEKLNSRIGNASRLLFLNNPHNPTGYEFTGQDYENLIWLAARENIMIIVDNAYHSFTGRKQNSLLSFKNGILVGAEVYSFSYLLGLPHIPFGFLIGNVEIVNGLKSVSNINKTFIHDFYIDLALKGFKSYPSQEIRDINKSFTQKKADLSELCDLLKLEKVSYDTIPFVWAKIKRRSRSVNAADILFRKSRIMVTPGRALGDTGEGYLRFSLTPPAASFETAVGRAKKKIKLLRLDKG